MKAKSSTKISVFFFCGFLSLLNGCASNSPPPPPDDAFYQSLMNDSPSAMPGRPPAPSLLTSQDGKEPASALSTAYPIPDLAPPGQIPPATAESPTSSPASDPAAVPYPNPYNNFTTAQPAPPPNQPGFLPNFIHSLPNTKPAPEEPTYDFSQIDCNLDESGINTLLNEVKKQKNDVIKTLPECLKLNRMIMMRAAIINPSEFQYAADILKEDESFVHRMLEINPQILQFASPSLRADTDFMEEATYLNRDALQYADAKLLNNKIFMRNMIRIDAKNYIFASDRLKSLPEFAQSAFRDNGLLLEYAPEKIKSDKKLVILAVKSNSESLQFASTKLREDKDLKKLAAKKSSIKSEDNLHKFLREHYVNDSDLKNIGAILDNRMKNFGDYKIIDRNYVTKWQRSFEFRNSDNIRLIAADSRNYPIFWKDDFKKFPLLIKKIEKFLLNHNVDQNTIDSLATLYFWKVKKQPQTVVFSLYLLRDSKDMELGPQFGNVTSLTAIAQKHGENWDLSVVEVIFDSEIKIDLAFENGHKKYVLWDLYEVDKNDQNPKIIFRVEDKFNEYFEIFEEQNNGKYHMVYRIDSLKDAANTSAKPEEKSPEEDSY